MSVRYYVLGAAILIVAAALLVASPLGVPCEVSGGVKIDNAPAPVGSELIAVIGTEEVARTTISNAGYYSMTIRQVDPLTADSKGYRSEQDVVNLYLDGRKAEPSFNPRAGKITIDVVSRTSLDVKLTTWGKIKALFK